MIQNELMEEKYKILMEFMPGGVVIYREKDGMILEKNRGFDKLFMDCDGQDEEVSDITNFYDVIPNTELDRVREMIETQLEFLHSVYLNVRLVGPNGMISFCEYRGRVLREDAQGKIYMVLLKDCNEETMLGRSVRQLEEKLQNKKREETHCTDI